MDMTASTFQEQSDLNLEQIMNDLEKESLYDARGHLNDLLSADIALLLSSLPIDYRNKAWELIAPEMMGEVLGILQGEVRIGLIEQASAEKLIAATNELSINGLANLVNDFPADVREKILLKKGDSRLETALGYDGNTVSGVMNLDFLTVTLSSTIGDVLAFLREQEKVSSNMDSLVVVNAEGQYKGMVSIANLLISDTHVGVADVMTPLESIPLNMPVADVALLFERKDRHSAAVVDENNKIKGCVSIDDVLDIVRDEAEHVVLSSAGLDEEHDLFSPVLVSARRRAVWLAVNLFTAFLASWVIGLFEATIEEIVALAVLMPIVASMGGIAGSQTLTLVIRGLALHQISASNSMKFLSKELAIGLVNGVVWSIVVSGLAGAWFSNMALGLMLGGGMIITLCCASLAGVLIPLFLQKRGIDPALAGGVLLTTVTDVIGFMSFLGLATIFLTN